MRQDLEAQLSQAVLTALMPAAGYVATLMRSSPSASAEWLLRRPDVNAVLVSALEEARNAAAGYAEQAWDESGGEDEPVIAQLLADIDRNFDVLPHLHGIIRAVHSKGPEDVQAALGAWSRQAALKARMTASYAAGAGETSLVLSAARDRVAAGEELDKRWRSRNSPSTCHWCRRLDGVTIGLDDDFHPRLGGPVAFPHQQARRVATEAGARRFGQPVGSLIVYTSPPKPYLGKLLGPLLHPNCECWLEIVPAGSRTSGGPLVPAPTPEAPEGFLSSEDIRAMPEAKYRSLIAFLEASVHELRQLLRRLARGGA